MYEGGRQAKRVRDHGGAWRGKEYRLYKAWRISYKLEEALSLFLSLARSFFLSLSAFRRATVFIPRAFCSQFNHYAVRAPSYYYSTKFHITMRNSLYAERSLKISVQRVGIRNYLYFLLIYFAPDSKVYTIELL